MDLDSNLIRRLELVSYRPVSLDTYATASKLGANNFQSFWFYRSRDLPPPLLRITHQSHQLSALLLRGFSRTLWIVIGSLQAIV